MDESRVFTNMDAEERLITAACLNASIDLGVRIVTPFRLESVPFIALYPDFGGPKGTAVCHFRDWQAKQAIASALGFFCSGLHPDSYSVYGRDRFVETFGDWGWQGTPEERPEWCRADR